MLDEIIRQLANETNSYNLYFTQKKQHSYDSYSPNIEGQIYKDLVALMIEHLSKMTSLEIVEYDPSGYTDRTIEKCDIDYVGNFDEISESFEEADEVDTEINPDKFTFYCLEINGEVNIKILRRVTKFKKLHAKGIIAMFNGNQLNKLDNKLIGIDGEIDLICYGEKILIFSHYSLERIFRLSQQFQRKASEFLNKLSHLNAIENIEQLKADCLNDTRIQKILTKMLNENLDLERTFNNFDNIEKTISMFDLNVEISPHPNPRIKYENKSQIMDVIRIIRDSYYESLINQELGIDDG